MRPTTRRWIYLFVAVALMAAASRLVGPIQQQRAAAGLTVVSPELGAAPGVALPILMAVGRAPVVDYLWLRAIKLKDQGRYFDALQLSELICKLQPRFGPVWSFHAWNMAYNISVTQETGEERWRWVLNGIRLLRDTGIPLNPHDTELYRELAWTYFHKVADYMDEKHWYYKNQFALSMEDILGPGDNPDWAGIAAAPREWSEVLTTPGVPELLAAGTTRKTDLSEPGVLLGLLNLRAERLRAEESPDANPVWAVLDDPKHAAAVRALECYWRARRVREEVKLDPKLVVDLRKVYGPMDFRLAEAHAFYWSYLGTHLGQDRAVRLDVQELNADRIKFYSIQNFFRRGKLLMSPEARSGVPPLLLPDTRFIPIFESMVREGSKKYVERERRDQVNTKGEVLSANFETAYVNFMRDAVVALYESGDKAGAEEMFRRLKEVHEHQDYQRDVDYFAMKIILDQLQQMTIAQALSRVTGYLTQAMALFAYGEDTRGVQYFRTARAVYDKYHENLPSRSTIQEFPRLVDAAMKAVEQRLPASAFARLKSKYDRAIGTAASQPAGGQENERPSRS